jgi:sugar-specific transcriptional regulator TrmB
MEDKVMETSKTKPEDSETTQELGDETFMSASDLRNYMTEMQMAKAAKAVEGMDRAENARKELIERLSEPIDLTPERLREIVQSLRSKLRSAAEQGKTELMVMRFPTALCTDKGRAINNSDKDWPETLTGRPRQAYELWRDQLKDAGFRLSAMIVEWPGGLPGDVGFFLKWGETKR